jgi:hypothetical protein
VIGGVPGALARRVDRFYLKAKVIDRRQCRSVPIHRDTRRMAQPVSTQMPSPMRPAPSRLSPLAVAGAGLGAALLLGALVLWFHYGTAVFFEMVASGISACF